MKIAFGMIVFEGDYVLKQCLEQVYPFASQILIAEGPVSYWQKQGKTTSTDNTNKILDEFPDPDNKIKIIHGQFNEKDDQCRAYMKHINEDIDYVWNLDSDEVYKTEDLKKIIKFLEDENPTSVGIQSCSFYGGFDDYLTGFELNRDNFLRIFKYTKGATWLTHRPPTIQYPSNSGIIRKHVDSDTLYNKLGVMMYHYSYVFPHQVAKKVGYYKDSVSKENCIDNYFERVYLPWVTGNDAQKEKIENAFLGVHEFKPHIRGECRTAKFIQTHPDSIARDKNELMDSFSAQLCGYKETHINSWKNSNVFDKQLKLNKEELNSVSYPLHWLSFLELMTKIQPNSILDVGCGCGAYFELCKKELCHVKYTGIDYSQEAIDIAKKTWNHPDFFVMDYSSLTNEFVSKFDVVHMGAVLDVLPNGDEALEHVMSLCPNNILIGRMKLTEMDSYCVTYTAYESITTYAYHHNINVVLKLAEKYCYDCFMNRDSVLFTRRKK